MPIKVACKCGKKFAAKDELAGKAVKCPGCGQPLKIPSPQQQKPQPGGKPKGPSGAAPKRPQKPAPSSSLDDLFDEVGIGSGAEEVAGPKCPACDAPIPANAVLCVNCGLNLQSGKRTKGLGAAVPGKKKPEDGHGAAAEVLLSRAERALQETPMSVGDDKSDSWVNAWLMMLALIAVAGVAFVMWLALSQVINAPEPDAETVAAAGDTDTESIRLVFLILMGGGGLLMMLSQILIAVHAFQKDDTLQGILCLFVGIYAIVYAVIRWDKLQRELILYGVAVAIYLLGLVLLVIDQVPGVIPSSPESLAQVVVALLIIALYMATFFLLMTAWVWTIVVAFMEEIYHGIIAIFIQAYSCTYAMSRRKQHVLLSKIWSGGLACAFLCPLVTALSPLMFSSLDGSQKLQLLKALGIGIASQLVPTVATTLVAAGTLFAAVALYNLLFGDTKNRVEMPDFGTALRIGFAVTFAIWTAGWLALPMGYAIHIAVPIVFCLLILLPMGMFVGADLLNQSLETGFGRGLVVSVMNSLLVVSAYAGSYFGTIAALNEFLKSST